MGAAYLRAPQREPIPETVQGECSSRQAFPTEARALATGRKLNARGLKPYRCGFCQRWHMGKEVGWKKGLRSE